MKAAACELRYQTQLARGCALVKEQGFSITKASAAAKIPPSTLWREIKDNRSKASLGIPTALALEEENAFVTIINEYAERGRPCARADIADIVQFMVSGMNSTRLMEIRFSCDLP